ncbi:MAG TPA: hypothetical protein DCM71_19300 [Runella sp.]|nr:hypothetical protein [Runella sp.]
MINTIIVDDHTLFNNGLCLILNESHQFNVIEQVYDSRQAYSKCFLLRPALVILDYNMPYLNGLEVTKQIKALPYGCKVVVVSMYADGKELSLLQEIGVDGYVAKTTASPLLVDALSRTLKGERLFITDTFGKTVASENKQQLTKRETQVLELEQEQYTTLQIASALALSVYTVETHQKNIRQKMNIK